MCIVCNYLALQGKTVSGLHSAPSLRPGKRCGHGIWDDGPWTVGDGHGYWRFPEGHGLQQTVDSLRADIVTWYEAREAWAHRTPFVFPDSAREVGWTSEEWIERKIAQGQIGDRADQAERHLEMLARAVLSDLPKEGA